jgi:hypothetical protein
MSRKTRLAQIDAELEELAQAYDELRGSQHEIDEDDEQALEAFSTNEFLLRDRMKMLEREAAQLEAG